MNKLLAIPIATRVLPFIALLTFGSFTSLAQTPYSKDSLINVMCKAVAENTDKDDSTRIHTAYRDHLTPFLDRFADDKRSETAKSIYFRMQTQCGVFNAILQKVIPVNDEYEKIIDRPTTFPKKKICRGLGDHKNYYYRDYNGDTVKLDIIDNVWVDHLKDGTYSKLSMKWLTNCEFELEFIESDNTIRNSLNRAGEKIRYFITGRRDNYFELAVDIIGTDKFLEFKVYY